MTRLQTTLKSFLLATGITACMGSMQAQGDGEPMDLTLDGVQEVRWQIDFKGKPPFKRKRVLMNVVDIAALEPVETRMIWKRAPGKPPYKRLWVEVPVVDAASLELVPVEKKKASFRGSPPFRRY